MWDKEKAITCLALSIIGWIVLIAAVLYRIYTPYRDEFSEMAVGAVLGISVITAIVIHIANCIFGIVLFLQETEYKTVYLTGLSFSIIFIVCCVIFCLFAFPLLAPDP